MLLYTRKRHVHRRHTVPGPVSIEGQDSLYTLPRGRILVSTCNLCFNAEHIWPGNAHTSQLTNAFWDIDVESLIEGDPGISPITVYNQISFSDDRAYETTIYGLNATALPGESAVYFLNEEDEPSSIPGAADGDRLFWIFRSMFPIVDGMVCTRINGKYTPEPVSEFTDRIMQYAEGS